MRNNGTNRPSESHRSARQETGRSFETQPRPAFLSFERPDTARFLVRGAPLPRLEDSLRIGELTRLAVMGVAGKLLGKESVPWALSGHGDRQGSPHEHAFFMQETENGRIRHLLVHAPAGFDIDCLMVFLSLKRIYEREGSEWGLALEALGRAADFAPFSALCAEARTWRSATPYLHPWHRKKTFGVEDQIRRECRRRGYPEIDGLTPVESIETAGRKLRPVHFRRFRKKKGLSQPDRNGGFWKIDFREPLRGPLALGFGCHFGLGRFEPEGNIRAWS